jgi:peptidoglycan/xylan/chitin deacetylase (PgdA/CDA1 family)
MYLFSKQFIALALGVALLAGVLTFMFSITGSRARPLSTEERIEVKQNKIPRDVLAWAQQQEDVLGLQYPPRYPLRILPKSLHVPILMYHYVEYVKDRGDTIRQSLATTPYTLEQEIITLKNAGYTFMTNRELTDVLDGNRHLPPNPILLTFDDGYRDFYTDVYPLLKKYNVKATEYIVTGFVGYRNNMTQEQVKEIADENLVEFGAHTINHVWLKGLTLKMLEYEVAQSKLMLEDLIGKPVFSFAYPYGAFDVAAVEAVHQAGFTSAVSTVPGIDQPQTHRYFLYRLRPGGRTGESLLSWLSSVKDEEISLNSIPGSLVSFK